MKKAGKEVTEISGGMSNPTADKRKDGVQIARKALEATHHAWFQSHSRVEPLSAPLHAVPPDGVDEQ